MSLLSFATRVIYPSFGRRKRPNAALPAWPWWPPTTATALDLNTLRRRYPASLNGVTLRALIQVASHLHLLGRPLRFELEHLRQLQLPAILHWDMTHFVVLKAVTRKGIDVHDPAVGREDPTRWQRPRNI